MCNHNYLSHPKYSMWLQCTHCGHNMHLHKAKKLMSSLDLAKFQINVEI